MALSNAHGPVLITDRLELWKPAKADLESLAEIVSHAATARFLGPPRDIVGHFDRLVRNAGSWLLYRYGSFILRERGQSAVIGTAGVFHSWRGLGEDFDNRPEAGWIIRHDRTGLGLAREAMDAALAWFDDVHGPRPVICMIAPENAPSLRLAARLGFIETRPAVLPDGEAVTLFVRG